MTGAHSDKEARRLVSIPRAAELVGRSEATIRRWIKDGSLESFTIERRGKSLPERFVDLNQVILMIEKPHL